MAMHNVYILASAEARLAVIAAEEGIAISALISECAEAKAREMFSTRDDDPAFKDPTDV